MVSFFTKGRFGNNFLIAASAWVYSKKYGLDFHVPKESIAPHVWPSNFQHLSNPNWNPDLQSIEVNDFGHAYRELPFQEEWRDRNIMIGTADIHTGYFHSYKYFSGYEEEIVKVFFKRDVVPLYSNHLAVHWRLGDYRTLPKHHPIVTKEYILEAIQKVEFLTNRTDFTIRFFSDEPDFVYDFSKKYLSNRTCLVSYAKSEIDDFQEMMFCEHQIVSNSSFSVLSAILNRNTNKIIIAPHEDNYMGELNKKLDVSDLMPKEWIRIKI